MWPGPVRSIVWIYLTQAHNARLSSVQFFDAAVYLKWMMAWMGLDTCTPMWLTLIKKRSFGYCQLHFVSGVFRFGVCLAPRTRCFNGRTVNGCGMFGSSAAATSVKDKMKLES